MKNITVLAAYVGMQEWRQSAVELNGTEPLEGLDYGVPSDHGGYDNEPELGEQELLLCVGVGVAFSVSHTVRYPR
ncbi:hypothetical protein Cantr_05853 [Candida viswanathii]|uniref:Uncharacterized protein n=1 Tax=Candida viswanathii TaxID=5486 RepID=A0A367XSQ4_9ASCO|nr:hypothetical protein Cantr_05853 [Candida viswanathii]